MSQEFRDNTAKLFDKDTPNEEFSISFEMASSIRDAVIAQRLPLNTSLQAFLPAHQSEVSMCNVKYIAGFCVFGIKKRLKRLALTSVRSKKTKVDPNQEDYKVKLLESLEDRSLDSQFNDEIDRKQQPGCRLFMPNSGTTSFFSLLNDSVREYETVCNVEVIAKDFYNTVRDHLVKNEELHSRFGALFHLNSQHPFLADNQNQDILHASAIEDLFEESLTLFLNMSSRSFRREYIQMKSVSKQEAHRKQIRMAGSVETSKTVDALQPPTVSGETTISYEEQDKEVCVVCSTKCVSDTICCDSCDTWCHYECVGVSSDIAKTIEKWFCTVFVVII